MAHLEGLPLLNYEAVVSKYFYFPLILFLVLAVTVVLLVGIFDEHCEHDHDEGEKDGGGAVSDGDGGDHLHDGDYDEINCLGKGVLLAMFFIWFIRLIGMNVSTFVVVLLISFEANYSWDELAVKVRAWASKWFESGLINEYYDINYDSNLANALKCALHF